jgi:hypothetical protein
MSKITRNFTLGRMNKVVDERLVPNGEYIDALNIRMGSTEQSEIGVIENSMGNIPLTSLSYNGFPLSNEARCIGAYEDGTNETIYWFVTDDDFDGGFNGNIDLIVSYDVKSNILTYHIISIWDGSTAKTTLNFNKAYLITGINKIEDLLFWTDDYNQPRVINVKRSYGNPIGGVDGFTEEAILVIKQPPIAAPVVVPTSTASQDNFLEERFICFAYRYRYEDGQYSATSQWSKPAFLPNTFNYDISTALNSGMISTSNMAVVTYNSGSSLVVGIDLLFKEMNSPIIRVIEKINKNTNGLADNTDYSFQFQNSKIFTILPDSEILRLYDNVPRLSKSQTMMGNRLMYGNYVEGYDLIDLVGTPLRLEYFSTLLQTEIGASDISYDLDEGNYLFGGNETIPNSVVYFDFDGIDLIKGAAITFDIRYKYNSYEGDIPPPTETQPPTTVSFTYILQQKFDSVYELCQNSDFIEKIGTISTIEPVSNSCFGSTFTDVFNCSVEQTLSGATSVSKYESGISAAGQPIQIISSPSSSEIALQLPAMRYVDNPASIGFEVYAYYEIEFAGATYLKIGNPTSLHSNRGYEVGIVYMDDFNRSSPALIGPNNAIHIPCSASEFQNQIQITIPVGQVAPYWAKRYKFVIKADRDTYETIYSQFFFRDPISGADYFLLEGQNSQKVEVGDELIVKKDTQGAVNTCAYTTVLEKQAQQADFLDPAPTDATGATIPVPQGVYMKLRANNFNTSLDTSDGLPSVFTWGEIPSTTTRTNTCAPINITVNYPNPAGPSPAFVDIPIPAGSKISINFESIRIGKDCNYGVEGRKYIYEGTFTASEDYPSFKAWWDGDNVAGTLNGPNSQRSATCNKTAPIAIYDPALSGGGASTCTSDVNLQFEQASAGAPMYLVFSGIYGWATKKTETNNKIKIEIIRANNLIVFETQPLDAAPNLWYESSEVFDINNIGEHQGNEQDQVFSNNDPAIVLTDFYNCYSFGNGVESYKIQDAINGKQLTLGNRAYITTTVEYKESRRFSDITYSGIYNPESNINKLNEFNLGLLNYKALESSFGPINKLFARETDVLTLQEDKISYVLAGKNLLSDAAAGSALTSVPEVLGTQIARIEEFGISNNPESFAQWGSDKFFTDAKRGSVLQLKGESYNSDQLAVISQLGMRTWFRDLFIESFNTQKLGGYDPYMNEYVITNNDIQLPIEEVCGECGKTIAVTVTENNSFSTCIDLGELVGSTDIEYTADSLSGTFTINANYNGNTYSVIDASTSGVLNFNKDVVNETKMLLDITSTDSVTLQLTFKCPQVQQITIILVTVTSNSDQGLFTTNQYRWSSGTFVSPLHTQNVEFSLSNFNPIISEYLQITGGQGGGVIPTDGALVTMFNNTIVPDDFVFNEFVNNFRYHRTTTYYGDTPTEIQTLLSESTTITPIYPPINGNTAYYGQFTMPATVGSYLYLIWDYRHSTPIDLCFGADLADSCCGCIDQEPVLSYVLIGCNDGLTYVAPIDTYGFTIGDTVQIELIAGGPFFCGTIVNTGLLVPDSAILNIFTYSCDDPINCP